jgi:2',3'-cyclic-nucleotide 2'-phosphodiesterase (5'-nucleotidase family)
MQVLGVASLAVVPASAPVRHSQPDLVGQDIQLTIVHTSDIHSRLLAYNLGRDAAHRRPACVD